jgi:hypothetical protein
VPVAPLVSWSRYGQHNPATVAQIYPGSGVKPEWTSDLTTFEAVGADNDVRPGHEVGPIKLPNWTAS